MEGSSTGLPENLPVFSHGGQSSFLLLLWSFVSLRVMRFHAKLGHLQHQIPSLFLYTEIHMSNRISCTKTNRVLNVLSLFQQRGQIRCKVD